MASPKEYGYFIKGSKIAIIEKDTALDNDVNSRDYGPGVNSVKFVSPRSSVTDGIELEYLYSPKYRITEVGDVEPGGTYLATTDGTGKLVLGGSGFSTDASIDYVVVRGSEKWDGLHKVTAKTTSLYTTDTPYNGSGLTTESYTIYTAIDVLNDESDELPISEYLSKAVVYYLKAKMAEDQGNFQLRDVMFKEFYRIVEKSDNSKIHTIRKVAPHSASIR